ncbi:MAG TPA: KUP/HAK/KT family potassium transporter, partial [Gemmatimonadaceae bacterium]|nr:KUP/HAK/KT family potassium transporter [Gemmatimonadaceae bacterium]
MTADPAQSRARAADPAPASPAISQSLSQGHPASDAGGSGKKLALLSLTALGIVYGDIGTSPLYAFKECFDPALGVHPTVPNIYGVLSLIVWALTLVISVKYIIFIMRADNRGEGGILALLALVLQNVIRGKRGRRYAVLVGLGLFGAALLFGEGVITPAISVLSAMEGLEVVRPALAHIVWPITIGILVALFLQQRRGTARIGAVFGPIMFLWFVSIGAFGLLEVLHAPGILAAINPWYGVQFFIHNGHQGFFTLGAVVLVITGAEALYADMGHFGRRPIRLAWFALVFPALLLNYFGQGALLLHDPAAIANPFYHLVPDALRYPMIALATTAAVIASQALISGAFSLIQQAVQLGYSPRMTILHTSAEEAGQIYVPEINKALMVVCIALVIGFRTSSALAAAYGVAVTGTMLISTVLYFTLARTRFHWPLRWAVLFLVSYLIIDASFFSANIVKFTSGAWVPLAIAIALYTMMTTWKIGRSTLRDMLVEASLPIEHFLRDVKRRKPPRVPGTAVFMTSDLTGAPVVLLHHLKHNKV